MKESAATARTYRVCLGLARVGSGYGSIDIYVSSG